MCRSTNQKPNEWNRPSSGYGWILGQAEGFVVRYQTVLPDKLDGIDEHSSSDDELESCREQKSYKRTSGRFECFVSCPFCSHIFTDKRTCKWTDNHPKWRKNKQSGNHPNRWSGDTSFRTSVFFGSPDGEIIIDDIS